jgi:hypothetical protein
LINVETFEEDLVQYSKEQMQEIEEKQKNSITKSLIRRVEI